MAAEGPRKAGEGLREFTVRGVWGKGREKRDELKREREERKERRKGKERRKKGRRRGKSSSSSFKVITEHPQLSVEKPLSRGGKEGKGRKEREGKKERERREEGSKEGRKTPKFKENKGKEISSPGSSIVWLRGCAGSWGTALGWVSHFLCTLVLMHSAVIQTFLQKCSPASTWPLLQPHLVHSHGYYQQSLSVVTAILGWPMQLLVFGTDTSALPGHQGPARPFLAPPALWAVQTPTPKPSLVGHSPSHLGCTARTCPRSPCIIRAAALALAVPPLLSLPN